ncbi:histidine acid phosphatase family protein [Abeliophyllum distichum]|uniref:Histidine acid phosphatase family protein n=1 Tax=Abeliophyllum distichum TaxID=126358 RepID=A0ABD1UQ21_9LAMI
MLKNENNFLTGLTLLLLIFFIAKINSNAEQNFDVRQHLSTVTRYHVAKEISEDSFVPSNINDQCKTWNTCSYQEKVERIRSLVHSATIPFAKCRKQKKSLHDIPAWLWGWKSHWKGKHKGGELIREGDLLNCLML